MKNDQGYRKAVKNMLATEAGRKFWQDVVKLAHRFSTRERLISDKLLDRKYGFDRKKTLL